MFFIAAVVLLLALGETGKCQAILPSAGLVIEGTNATWKDYTTGETNLIDPFPPCAKLFTHCAIVHGVTPEQKALLVGPGNYTRLRTLSEAECISDITNCPNKQITFTFWLKVLKWRDSGNQFIFQTAILFLQTGLVIHSRKSEEFRVYFNGDGLDYEFLTDWTRVEEWSHLAIVIDGNVPSMKVYLNGTEIGVDDDPDSRSRSRSGTWITIGQNTQTPDYYIADIKIYYTALTEAQLKAMFNATLNDAIATEAVTTTTSVGAPPTTTPMTSKSTVTTVPSTVGTSTQTTTAHSTSTAHQTTSTAFTTSRPAETTSTPSTPCTEVTEKFTKAYTEWKVRFEDYIEAFEDWKEKKNSAGQCQ